MTITEILILIVSSSGLTAVVIAIVWVARRRIANAQRAKNGNVQVPERAMTTDNELTLPHAEPPPREGVPSNPEVLDRLLNKGLLSQEKFETAKRQLGGQGERIVCPNCRTSLPSMATSCFNCGYSFTGETASNMARERSVGLARHPYLALTFLGIMFLVEGIWLGTLVSEYSGGDINVPFFIVMLIFGTGLGLSIMGAWLDLEDRRQKRDSRRNK